MPLASLAFTGCVAGQVAASGSTHPRMSAAGGVRRGWGGNGNGAGSQPVLVLPRLASMARQIAYAPAVKAPTPTTRHNARRRIVSDCRTRAASDLCLITRPVIMEPMSEHPTSICLGLLLM